MKIDPCVWSGIGVKNEAALELSKYDDASKRRRCDLVFMNRGNFTKREL